MAITTPTVDDVRVIITTTLSDARITALIADAVLMVENCVASMTEARQAAIVKYVTAHLISLLPESTSSGGAQITSKALGDASESYASPTLTRALDGSSYGQQALLLDPSGCLANLGKQRAYLKAL